MNVKQTNEYFEENGIIAVRADKGVSKTAGQIDNLLEQLGNKTRAIPFYAIYPPGGGEPQVMEGLISSKGVIDIFEKFESDAASKTESQMSQSSESTSTEITKTRTKKVAARN